MSPYLRTLQTVVNGTTAAGASDCLYFEGAPCVGSTNFWKYITVPFVAGLIGYGTNVVALILTFYPVDFVGWEYKRFACGKGQPIGCFGWQGIIPTKATKMATICIKLMTEELFKLQDIFCRLDPEIMADIMKPDLDAFITTLLDDVGNKFIGTAWEMHPFQDSVYKQGRILSREMILSLMDEVKRGNVEKVIDVQRSVVTLLEEDKALMNRVFQTCGKEEFIFIERSGAYLGFLFGVIQAVAWYYYKANWVLPLAGFFVGYATNFIALAIIFRPVNPVQFCGCTWQGVFLARQAPVSRVFAKIMADEVVTPQLVWRFVLDKKQPRSKEFYLILNRQIKEMTKKLLSDTVGLTTFLGLKIGPGGLQEMHAYIQKRVHKVLPRLIASVELDKYMTKAFNLEYVLRTAMQGLPAHKFEGVLHPVFQEDELKLIVVGGVLGAAAGVAQLFTMFA
jgi:uncharacterized membrane protein YheB (UPF0754 family)